MNAIKAPSTALTRSAYALLADGTTAEIGPATPGDTAAVTAMLEAMSPENSYLRSFSFSRLSAEQEAGRVCRAPAADHAALLATVGGQLAGVASYEVTGDGHEAEIAFAVADDMHGRGIGTLLLEHLISDANRRDITTLTASVLAQNAEMQKVFADAGLSMRRELEDGVIELTCELPHDDADPRWDRYLDAAALRERMADVASLRHVFQPDSVAVVGASRRMGTVGRAILHNIVTAGYQGRVYAVNPHAAHMEAVPCVRSVTALPEPVDLAVVAVPPAAVCAVADKCGRRGIKALVVITVGLDMPQGADLLAICRRYGMRLVGPGCFGIAVPGIGLDATFAARHPAPGTAGLVMQSGGLGSALADRLSRLGVGVSSFASVGSKYDVSSNDMLMWWEQDQATKLAVLYTESFGNPRKFARTARQVGQTMPVLTVPAGRSPAGQRAAAPRTAAAATPPVTHAALFRQAGIIATDSLGELVDVAALLATQPLPACAGRGGLQRRRRWNADRRRLLRLRPDRAPADRGDPAAAARTGPPQRRSDQPDRHDRHRNRKFVPALPGTGRRRRRSERGPRRSPANRRHRRPGRGHPRRRRPGPARRGHTRPARTRPAPAPRQPRC